MRADSWPPTSLFGRIMGHVRTCVCTRLCGGTYDEHAGRIVDAAIAERDQLLEEVRRLRATISSEDVSDEAGQAP